MKKNITFSILKLSIFLLLNPATIKSQCHLEDWLALRALYLSTDGDNWTNNTGWEEVAGTIPTSNCYLETLYGVFLNANGRVNCIDMDGADNCMRDYNLNGNNINGFIPYELGSLSYLEVMYFTFNSITGNIPSELSNLNELIIMDLSNNQLSGSIPVSLGSLPKITILDLSSNQISGTIPAEIGNLNTLFRIDLSYNLLSGNLPTEITNLTYLSSIKLSENNLTGNLPSEIGNLSRLQSLNLTNNMFNGNIPTELGNLQDLSFLNLGNNDFNGNIPLSFGNLINLEILILIGNELTGPFLPELGNLGNLTNLLISYNSLNGCYDNNLKNLCTLSNNPNFNGNNSISEGNNFDDTWQNFCSVDSGSCSQENNESNVYPGDLNNDGIVNNQDIGRWGLHLFEQGPPRATEHQITDWNPYPAENWGIPQFNYEDIKHYDTNGNGKIEVDDCQAVTANYGQTWSPATTVEIPEPPVQSDYQVMLHPIEEVYDGYLVMNVALERRAGGSMDIRGGHFTVDYSNIEGNISTAALNLAPVSWLGVPTIDLWYESTPFPVEKKIEVGFTKTNNANSEGNGVIGQLILAFDNSGTRQAKNTSMYEFRVNTIGVHNSQEFTQMEDQLLQVNVDDSNYCQPNWMIDENTPFQNQYKSDGDIETNGFVIIGAAQEVLYQAGNIQLNSGFSVKAGASFRAAYGSCE